MARYILLNATKNPALKPGDVVDDNTIDIRQVQSAGGTLVAVGDPVLDQVSAELQTRTVSPEDGAAIMLAAYTEFVQRGLAATDVDVAVAQADIANGGVVGAAFATPADAAAQALRIGPRFGSVTLQALGTGADDDAREAAVNAACAGKYEVTKLPGTWYHGATPYVVPESAFCTFGTVQTTAAGGALTIVTIAPPAAAGSTIAFAAIISGCTAAGGYAVYQYQGTLSVSGAGVWTIDTQLAYSKDTITGTTIAWTTSGANAVCTISNTSATTRWQCAVAEVVAGVPS
jgi:hypothetical protein